MRKKMGSILFCIVISGTFWVLSLFHDRSVLDETLIRIHVVANSDSEADQVMKLKIRDAICSSIERDLREIQDPDTAVIYLKENLPKLYSIANLVLAEAGCTMDAEITLSKEIFPSRIYDTFRLPAGVYETLRVTIGDGKGENWWCVAFPALCTQSAEEFEEAAVCAGFSPSLANSLRLTKPANLRFYMLDAVGRLTAFFCE